MLFPTRRRGRAGVRGEPQSWYPQSQLLRMRNLFQERIEGPPRRQDGQACETLKPASSPRGQPHTLPRSRASQPLPIFVRLLGALDPQPHQEVRPTSQVRTQTRKVRTQPMNR